MRLARLIRIGLGIAAFGVGSLAMSGVAMADAPEPGAQPEVTIVTIDNTVTQTSSTSNESATIGKTTVADNSVAPKAVENSSASVQAVYSASQVPTIPTAALAPSPMQAPVAPVVAVQNMETASPAESQPPKAPPAIISLQPIVSVHTPSAYTLMTGAYGDTATTMASQPIQPMAATQAPILPLPDKTPVVPFGAVGTWLAIFSKAVPAKLADFSMNSGVTVVLWISLIVLVVGISSSVRIRRFSFGTWLKQTGYVMVARSGLPNVFSQYATPQVMGYVSAPAPYA